MKIKSVIASLTASCLLLFNVGSAYCAEGGPDFKDIKGSFAEQSINYLTQQGIIHGINAEQFAPRSNVTRLQFAVLIAKALGVQPYFPSTPTFSDIPSGSVEAGYVEGLASLGLIKGTGDQIFNGSNPVMRQDAAVIIKNALDNGTQESYIKGNFNDENRISPYAFESVAYIINNGWMKGSKGYLYPLQYLTRAEAAVLINRLLESRKDQALEASQQQEEQIELKSGETKKIKTNVQNFPIAFTPVYGTDNSVAYSVYSSGGTISGKQPGSGTLTLNVGSASYQVKVDVSGPVKGKGIPEQKEFDNELVVTPKVVEHVPDSGFKNVESKYHPGPVDGLSSKSDDWTGFLRQQGRDVIVDLNKLDTVSSVSMEFMQNAGAGVYLPKYIKGFVSADGVSWYRLGQVYHGVESSDKKVQNVTLSLNFPSITARYIKISFPVDVWVFARHLTVKGGAPAEKPAILAPDLKDTDSDGTYLNDPKIKDILLVYTGNSRDQQTLTGDDFLPMVAYVNRQKEIKGRMFDSMLFLPYNGMPCTKDSWDSYLEDLFAPGKQLNALEDTVAKINKATGSQKKENVILTVPYPDFKQSNFGSLEENGRSLSFSEKNGINEIASQNRLKAMQWFYGELMDKWKSAGFTNLNLSGIYWYGESIDRSIKGEEDLVKSVAQMVRSNGQNFFWIPSYGAQGYQEWKSYGFTHVFLQPNYYSTQNAQEDRLDSAAELAKQYKTGIELELDTRVITNKYYYDLLYKELAIAHQKGLDRDASIAYYVGLKQIMLDLAYSDFSDIRAIYDDLYKWISGSYK